MLNKVITEAQKWVGYLEKKSNKSLESFTENAGSGNYTYFAKKYYEYWDINFQGQPWCAMFVSVVFRLAIGEKNQSKIMPHFSYCPTGVNQFKSLGLWEIKNPQVGDIIFFKNTSGIACHVGIVYKVDKNYVYTIEGNTSSASGVVENGGAVEKKMYQKTYSRILGYGRPKYEVLVPEHWAKVFLDILKNKGYIQNPEIWSEYGASVSKSTALALIDKLTGGKWDSPWADVSIHWVQPHVLSLTGKSILENKEQWLENPDENISKALTIALIDKATNGTIEKYKGRTNVSHWAQNNLESLQEKGIIETPEAWTDYDSNVTRDIFMALVCKAFNIK